MLSLLITALLSSGSAQQSFDDGPDRASPKSAAEILRVLLDDFGEGLGRGKISSTELESVEIDTAAKQAYFELRGNLSEVAAVEPFLTSLRCYKFVDQVTHPRLDPAKSGGLDFRRLKAFVSMPKIEQRPQPGRTSDLITAIAENARYARIDPHKDYSLRPKAVRELPSFIEQEIYLSGHSAKEALELLAFFYNLDTQINYLRVVRVKVERGSEPHRWRWQVTLRQQKPRPV